MCCAMQGELDELALTAPTHVPTPTLNIKTYLPTMIPAHWQQGRHTLLLMGPQEHPSM